MYTRGSHEKVLVLGDRRGEGKSGIVLCCAVEREVVGVWVRR